MSPSSQYPGFERLIIHISDTHLLAGGHKLYGSIDTEATVRDFLTRVVNQGAPVDALVIWVIGNHGEGEPFAEVFCGGASTSPQDRVYDLGGPRVIALETSVPGCHQEEL